jgi:hypothetical protein
MISNPIEPLNELSYEKNCGAKNAIFLLGFVTLTGIMLAFMGFYRMMNKWLASSG